MALRRLQKELNDIQHGLLPSFCQIEVSETNVHLWKGLITPENPPYNKGAFKIEIIFPQEYPFKPPKIMFLTKIYHPNVDDKGEVCLPIINAENWKPATRAHQVIEALVKLIDDPEPEHSLRPELAEEFIKDRKKFMKMADEFTKKHAERRPK